MVERFHADPRIKATELLLQERMPRHAPVIQPRPPRRRAWPRRSPPTRAPLPLAAHDVPARAVPLERQLRRRSSPTPAAAPASAAAARSRAGGADATRDPGSQFIYLRDVRTGAVWSATAPADARRARGLRRHASRRSARCSGGADDGIATQLEIAVSPEDDVEVRRLAITNHSDRVARDRGHELRRDRARHAGRRPRAPGVRQAVRRDRIPARERGAALPPAARAARSATRSWAVHVAEPRGPARRARSSGKPTAAASSAAGAARTIRRRSTAASLSGTTGAVLDPIVSLRQRVRLAPGGFARLSFATGVAPNRETAVALAQKYHEPARRRARSRSPSRTRRAAAAPRHHERRGALFERLASRVLYLGRLAARRRRRAGEQHARPAGALGARHLRRPADRAGPRRRRGRRCRSSGRC